MEQVFITGANRGLGLEFVRQYLQAGTRVIATCRDPERADGLHGLVTSHAEPISIRALDVTDEAAVEQLGRELADETIDVVINNAGLSPRGERFDNVHASDMLAVFEVNSVAPLIVARALHPSLKHSRRPRIINVSSAMGSLERKDYGRHYSYGASKAALNMITRATAHDLREDGIVVVALHPGWVQTDLGGAQATLSPRESVNGMRRVIDRLGPPDSGMFLTWTGETHPW